MGTTGNGVGSTTREAQHAREVACSRCGRVVKYPREWVMADNGTIICASCYQEIFFRHISDYSMEVFD